MSNSLSNTNPNSFGGSFNYDSRTGLGIGSLSGGPQKGIGSNWNMGDALSSPKGEWDQELEDEEEFDKLDADIESKAHTSYQRRATDSLAHRGGDISSLGGLGNSIAGVIGLSAGHYIKGDIVSEDILVNYIKEAIMFEVGNQISGNVVIKSKGKSDLHKNLKVSTNTADAAPIGHLPVGRSGFNNKGYGQKKIKVRIKTAKGYSDQEMAGTTDGGETIKSSSSEISFNEFNDNNSSTFDILNKTTDREFLDSYNVLSKNKKTNIYK